MKMHVVSVLKIWCVPA